MRYVYTAFLLGYFLALTGCSSTPRTKWTDKSMTIGIHPGILDPANTMELTSQFMQSNRWNIVDRMYGLDGVMKEQDMVHVNLPGRFDDKRKYSHWKKLYGIGALIVPFAQCEYVPPEDAYEKRKCHLVINMVDTNTGQTLVSVSGSGKWKPGAIFKEWKGLVEQFEERYPKYFPDRIQDEEELVDYQELSGRLAKDPKTND